MSQRACKLRPQIMCVLIAIHVVVPVREASIQVVIEYSEIVPFPNPLGVPLRVPCVVHVQRKVRPADRPQGSDSSFVPALNLIIVGWLIQEL